MAPRILQEIVYLLWHCWRYWRDEALFLSTIIILTDIIISCIACYGTESIVIYNWRNKKVRARESICMPTAGRQAACLYDCIARWTTRVHLHYGLCSTLTPVRPSEFLLCWVGVCIRVVEPSTLLYVELCRSTGFSKVIPFMLGSIFTSRSVSCLSHRFRLLPWNGLKYKLEVEKCIQKWGSAMPLQQFIISQLMYFSCDFIYLLHGHL